MSRFDGATVQIIAWAKYNGRNDIKRCSWLRLENTISTTEGMFGLNAAERYIFIELMCLASQKNSNTFKLNVSYIADRAGATEQVVNACVEKLLKNQTLAIVKSLCTDLTDLNVGEKSVTDPSDLALTDGRTDTHDADVDANASVSESPFEEIYKAYPRRKGDQGRKKAMKRLESEITSESMRARLLAAVLNYAAYCDSEKITGTQFVKQFVTFVSGSWEEWEQPPPTQEPLKLGTLEDLQAENARG